MVHNGVEYGIMQAYAEGFNILHEANSGAKYVAEGDAEVAPMDTPEDYQYDIDTVEVAELWRRGSVVGSWLLDLTADVLRHDNDDLKQFDGGVSDSGEGRWTLHAAVDLGVPTPVISAALFERFNSRKLGQYANKILNGMRYMFGGHNVR
jgi:6-phosphogluconate dehydrogenase